MKDKLKLILLTFLSIVLTGLFYYMSYIFNPKYYNIRAILTVLDYRNTGGLLRIIIIFSLLIIFSILLIAYIISDNNKIEVFSQSGNPEYYAKNNKFSWYRIIQYYTLVVSYSLLLRDGIRTITYSDSLQSTYIFKTDILFVMWDTIFLAFLLTSVTLIYELSKNYKTIEIQ